MSLFFSVLDSFIVHALVRKIQILQLTLKKELKDYRFLTFPLCVNISVV